MRSIARLRGNPGTSHRRQKGHVCAEAASVGGSGSSGELLKRRRSGKSSRNCRVRDFLTVEHETAWEEHIGRATVIASSVNPPEGAVVIVGRKRPLGSLQLAAGLERPNNRKGTLVPLLSPGKARAPLIGSARPAILCVSVKAIEVCSQHYVDYSGNCIRAIDCGRSFG